MLGYDHRGTAGHGADDGRAAANGPEPRLRRVLRHAVGIGEYYLEAPDVPPFMMAVLAMEVILGSLTLTGSLMAAGKLQEVLPQRPITYRGQNFVNLGLLAVAIALAGYMVYDPSQALVVPVHRVDLAGVRRDDDHPDRRCRHADGDLLAEFLRRTLGRGDGLRCLITSS